MDEAPVLRPTVRVLVLDRSERLLLIHAGGEIMGQPPAVWMPPGSGLQEGESYEAAAARELAEEVGLQYFTLGDCVWTRSFPYELDGQRREKRERYYICRVDTFEVDAGANLDRESVLGYRWWSADEIEHATDQLFVPRALASLLRPILSGELPTEPIEVGV
jgi:ADP-ribose pyrophosphatase YjhB (NUDIX family)